MSYSMRDNKLVELSQIVINGHVTFKLDFIAHISINNNYYFSVFRRYNSPYEIVIEDMVGDVHVHYDTTVRESLQNILCLTEETAANIYTYNAISYKHNGPVPTMSCDIADLKWTDIQTLYQGINVNFRGVLENYGAKVEDPTPPSTPLHYPSVEIATPLVPYSVPLAPQKPSRDEAETARILCSIRIPKMANLDEFSESDEPSMSMRHSDVKQRTNVKQRRTPRCYCECEEEEEEEEEDEQNYIVLRNGTMIPRAQ
jgi:hypothetical protein